MIEPYKLVGATIDSLRWDCIEGEFYITEMIITKDGKRWHIRGCHIVEKPVKIYQSQTD